MKNANRKIYATMFIIWYFYTNVWTVTTSSGIESGYGENGLCLLHTILLYLIIFITSTYYFCNNHFKIPFSSKRKTMQVPLAFSAFWKPSIERGWEISLILCPSEYRFYWRQKQYKYWSAKLRVILWGKKDYLMYDSHWIV